LIEEARWRARRRRLAIAGVVAMALGIGIWAGLSFTGGNDSAPAPVPAGFVRVQARGPVEYAVLDERAFDGGNGVRTTTLETGADAPSSVTEQYWYDAASKLSRDRFVVDGLVRKDVASSCLARCAPVVYLDHFDPSRSGFADAGFGSLRGRQIRWFTRADGRALEKVAVDPRSREFVGMRSVYRGRLVSEVVVVRRTRLPASEVSFVVPKSGAPQPVYGNTAAPSDGVTLGYGFDAGRTTLGRSPLWLGPRFRGLPLRSVSVGVYSYPNKGGTRLRPAPYVRLDYGGNFDYASKVARGALTIEEFGAARPWFYEQGPRPGTIVRDWLAGAGLIRDGLLVRFSNAGRFTMTSANAVTLARTLRPVPPRLKTLPTLHQQ
jgi:hypothetical protein